jgi:hypothetical protein
VAARGELTWDGGSDTPPPGGRPWLLPEGVDHAVLALAGHRPAEVAVAPGDVVVRPVVLADTEGDLRAASFARAVDALFEASGEHDPVALARRLGTPEAIAAYVREHVGVLGTAGLQRSPEAVLRLGAGGPVDRANLVISMLRSLGKASAIVCGDLPRDVARSLYAPTVTVPPAPPPLAERLAEGVPAVAALAGSLASSLSALPDRPLGAQHTYRLVPEWCWVEVPSPDRVAPPVSLDLRPPPYDRAPMPFAWRSADRLGTEVWTVELQLTALVRTPTGVQNLVLAHQGAPVSVLDDRGVLVDLRPGHTPSTMIGSLTWFDEGEARAAVGEEAPADAVEAVTLGVTWRDPSDIASRSTGIELWQTDGEPVPVLRVLVAPDPGIADATSLATHLEAMVDRRAPVPGGEALAARHALYGRLRLALSGGVITESPTLVATIATLGGDGAVGWRIEALPPQPPVSMGGAADLVTASRASAADAVARALVLGVPVPSAPEVWLRGETSAGALPPLPQPLQIAVMRSLGALIVGASRPQPPATASVWMLDPLTGGVTWYQGVTTARTPDVVPADLPVAGHPQWPFARWDLSLRCAEALRWTAWAGRPLPEACR